MDGRSIETKSADHVPIVFKANPFKHTYPILRHTCFGVQGKQTCEVRDTTTNPMFRDMEEDDPQIQYVAKPFRSKSVQKPYRLRCGVMNYAWGKQSTDSAVAQWMQEGDPTYQVEQRPYAELWVGTHTNAPSYMQESTGSSSNLVSENSSFANQSLHEFLQRNPATLGDAHTEQFGTDLPYLLKILSVATALSIQAHPEKSHAERLHASDPDHYPDPNHKPEAVVALSNYKAMCSFRPLPEIAHHLQTIDELRALVHEDMVERFVTVVGSDGSSVEAKKEALKSIYMELLLCDSARVQQSIDAMTARLRNSTDLSWVESTFLDLTVQYPGDGGCFQVFFLNLIELKPGEGLFLAANEPHAYIHGDAVEIMARSDNVVRAGLTPKFKDHKVMGEMLSYDTQPLHIFRPNNEGPLTSYCPPPEYPDFKLLRVSLTEEWPGVSYELGKSSGCLLVTQGSATLLYCGKDCTIPTARLEVSVGSAYFLPSRLSVYFSRMTDFVAFIGECQIRAG